MHIPEKKYLIGILGSVLLFNPTVALTESLLLEEIIVTAQKREQAVTDVGLSITAFTADTIRALGVEDIRDVTFLLPNIDIKGAGLSDANPAITIRGVGLNNFNANNNPAVGIYSDEVFLTSPAMINLALLDVERIEVLKGPQGTLYGRNSTGGALNVLTVKPSQEADGFVSATVGAYETTKVEAAYGTKLSDVVSGRLSVLYDRQGESFHEYFENNGNSGTATDFGTSQNSAIRAQLAGDHNQFNWNLAASYLNQDIVNSPFSLIGGYWEPGAAFVTPCANVGGNSLCETTIGINSASNDGDVFTHEFSKDRANTLNIDSDVTNVTFNFSYVFNNVTLTSITGWGEMDRKFGEDIWSIPTAVESFSVIHDEEFEQFSEEIRLSGEGNSLRWIAGLFYSNDTFASANTASTSDLLAVIAGVGPILWDNDQETTAFAVFASFDWLLTDQLTLSTGLRYSDEETDFVGGSDGVLVDLDLFEGFVDDPVNLPAGTLASFGLGVGDALELTSVDSSFEDDNVSWRVALEYRPDGNQLYYGSISTGFKSGGFFGDFTFDNGELDAFNSETIAAYELGAKLALAKGKAQINGSVFYYDYDDIQTLIPASFGFRLANLENATIFGVDLEVIVNPIEGLDLRLALGYLNTEVKSPLDDFDGNKLPNAPDFQFSGLIRYEHSVASNLNLAYQIDFKTTDDAFRESGNNPTLVTDGYTVVNARIALLPADAKWEVALWSKNITDEEYFQEKFTSDVVGGYVGLAGNPATYGVTYSYNF